MSIDIWKIGNDATIETVLNMFLVAFDETNKSKLDNSLINSALLGFLLNVYDDVRKGIESKGNNIIDDFFDDSEVFAELEKTEWKHSLVYLHYLIGELVCNIQQHSHSSKSWGFVDYNKELNTVDVCFADNGISIHGSFIDKDVYLDKLIYGDASAINLAQKGFSTKDRPYAENRGYGISSNLKIITNILGGTFSILSGKALYIKDKGLSKMINLPPNVDWAGTIVIARVPLPPNEFNMYNYL